ncbi:hypothetical protein CFC21_069824 [Triticum aestivum]|uniref:Uncharacterized protein n=2 Tax=Triticum aestivum TaxID=4565 RepID=A0A3B6LFX2_WHEAT|nr:uncharacterized protein LOC119305117 [Triticum dicoccoides]XP_044392640.1 uncharacterized protein LOC123115572 [Triticum aestivum]KAF7063297.1 hypothetical protein CFC21_069824 [Triticum aestivum]
MDGNKKLVTAAEKTIPATVQRASRWALYNACFTVGHAVTYALLQSSFALRCVQWTDAKAAQESALCLWMLRCAVLQAAAAALALHLSCRRRWVRHALAYLALVVAFVGHCMYVAAVRLLLAADCPGYVLLRILCTAYIAFFLWGDLLYFLGLLLGGDN